MEARVREILLAAGDYEISSDPGGGHPPSELIIVIVHERQDPLSVLAVARTRLQGTPVLPILDRRHLAGDLDRLFPDLTDFMVSPVRAAELLARVRRLLAETGRADAPDRADSRAVFAGLDRLRGTDPAFEAVKRRILLAAKSAVPVLVTGETGTGKELTAHAIHYLSDRATKPFLPVNCGAIPGELFENELFGHQRGAFTDARSNQPGLIAEAEGGTLFLDEVDALSPSGQIKLLRFLEDGSYRPLGSPRGVQADVRVVVATNADIRRKVHEGAFRDDLFYRLNVVTLHLPPLRERVGDIPVLAGYFLQKYGKNDDAWRFSSEALDVLCGYAWPGNIRELENIVRHVVVMNPPKLIQPEDLPIPFRPIKVERPDDSFRVAKARAIARFERSYLTDLLKTYRGNITQAARAAGQDRHTFRRLLQKYGLEASAWARPGADGALPGLADLLDRTA